MAAAPGAATDWMVHLQPPGSAHVQPSRAARRVTRRPTPRRAGPAPRTQAGRVQLPACLPARPPARPPARLPACPPARLPARRQRTCESSQHLKHLMILGWSRSRPLLISAAMASSCSSDRWWLSALIFDHATSMPGRRDGAPTPRVGWGCWGSCGRHQHRAEPRAATPGAGAQQLGAGSGWSRPWRGGGCSQVSPGGWLPRPPSARPPAPPPPTQNMHPAASTTAAAQVSPCLAGLRDAGRVALAAPGCGVEGAAIAGRAPRAGASHAMQPPTDLRVKRLVDAFEAPTPHDLLVAVVAALGVRLRHLLVLRCWIMIGIHDWRSGWRRASGLLALAGPLHGSPADSDPASLSPHGVAVVASARGGATGGRTGLTGR